jgi:uncharacterized protein HemX
MVTGFKSGPANQGIRRTWTLVALAIVLGVAGFWWLQWKGAPKPETAAASHAARPDTQSAQVTRKGNPRYAHTAC